MIESIIDYLNAKLALIGYFDKRYCLTEMKSEGENTFPVCYSANGDWKKIEIDQHDGVTYWRKSGDVSSSKVENQYTTDILYETTFPMRLVAFKRRGDVGADNQYTSDRLVDVIKKQVTFVNETLKSTLKVRKVESIVTSSTTNSADVLADEFDPPFAPDVPFKWSAVSIEVDIMVVGTRDCMDACPTDNDILHGFDFCNQAIVDRLTPTQKTCLQNDLCGVSAAATLDINGAPFTTIPSGDTYDLDVVNSDDDAVGVSSSGDWVIADSTVRNNATPTWSDTVKAEATITLDQAKMQDSDGSTVNADYIPGSQGFMFTATSCPPCADANIEVNGVAVGTVASGGTFDQLVQDDLGASVGTSANPSIVADCVVNNDASSPTFTQNIQPEQTFSLAQGKMLDSDGATTVLADYKPNTDGFMFTASACPAPSDVYIRPADWIAMPTLSDGDDKIVLLVAVWENASNFISLKCRTSAGTYTIDWGDGNTTSGIVTNTQSDHAFDFTGLSASTFAYGYRQSIVTITADSGNLERFNNNTQHASANNEYSTGVLECNIASQTITNIGSAFSSTNVQTFPFMERFEYIGTCNVTNWTSTFYRAGIIDFKATATAATACTSLFRESNVRYLSGAIGNGSCNGTSIFHNTRNLETIGNFDISGLSIITNGFFTSVIQTIGTPSNPVSLNPSGVTATSFARGCPLLREVHFDGVGYLKSNQSVMFYQCKNLTVIKGLNGQGSTILSTGFFQNYGLQILRSSNIGVSFSLQYSNFSTQSLIDVFNDLATATATITVTGNPGVAGLTPTDIAIATAKGWTVTT